MHPAHERTLDDMRTNILDKTNPPLSKQEKVKALRAQADQLKPRPSDKEIDDYLHSRGLLP